MAKQTVELAPGESKVVTFEAIPHEAKTYQVSVDGLSGSFVVIAPVGIVGDLNDDGIVDWADFDILQLYILGRPISEISPLPEAEFLRRADVNGDGAINVLDMTALQKMLPIANLYGVVTDTETGTPIEGVSVTIDGKTTSTNAGGEYGFENIRLGDYVIEFSKEGYETISDDIGLVEGSNVLDVVIAPAVPAWATSEVTTVGAALPSWCPTCWMLCSLSVTNQSGSPAPCSVALHSRYFMSPDYTWTDWRELLPKNLSSYRNTVSDYQAALDKYDQLTMLTATLAPGETKVFSGVIPNMISKRTGMPRQWVKFVGPFGEVVAPSYFLMVEVG